MAGKGSAWRKGEVRKKFGANEDYWDMVAKKKEEAQKLKESDKNNDK